MWRQKKIIAVAVLVSSLLSVRAQARFVGLGMGEEATPVQVVQAPAILQKWVSRFHDFFVMGIRKEVNLPVEVLSKKTALASMAPSVSMTKAVTRIKNLNINQVKVPGVPFKDKNLILGHNGVPVFEFKKFRARMAHVKIRHVPLLNVWTEPILEEGTVKDFNIEPFMSVKYEPAEEIQGPVLMSEDEFKRNILGEPVILAGNAENIEIPFLEPERKVTPEKIAKLVYKLDSDARVTEFTTVKFTGEDLKLLRGLILFEKKDQCHIASGIFSDLVNEASSEDVRLQSHYLLGLCLHEMNLPTEALFHLRKVIKSGNESYLNGAIKAAVEDLPPQYEAEVGDALNSLKSDNLIPEESKSDVAYIRAKFFIKHGQPQKAFEQALKVPNRHPKYYEAQYLASVAEYENGNLEAAMDRERQLAVDLMRKGTNKEILALIQVNLGRVAFEKGKYKDSLDAFQRVPKEHPLWLQALTEQAWTQLQSKDAAGAIGNMHSIQSPYFDGVYKPESYVVRAIGYLNICQYADAFKSVAYLEHFYVPWLDKIEAFNKSGKDPYDVVLKQLRSKGTGDVDGLPFQVIREAARQKDFLNAQEAVNQLIDENGGYNFVKGLIEKDRRSLLARRNAAITKIGQLKVKISTARSTPGAMKNFNAWKFELANYEEFLNVYEFKVQTLKEGMEGFDRLAPAAQSHVAEQKVGLKKEASRLLQKHLTRMASDLRKNLENDELLKYEIYAGSGENLRFKVAGGKVGVPSGAIDRRPSSQKWDFAGEFWEDEIGNYRSSLKNNCQSVAAQRASSSAREAK